MDTDSSLRIRIGHGFKKIDIRAAGRRLGLVPNSRTTVYPLLYCGRTAELVVHSIRATQALKQTRVQSSINQSIVDGISIAPPTKHGRPRLAM